MMFPILVFSGICIGMVLLGLRTPKNHSRTVLRKRAI
jgi:hypothetical protein